MKKIAGIMLGMMVMVPAWADVDLSSLLNKVSLQLKADKWVTSQTAKVIVSVDAGLSDQGIEALQTKVMGKLGQISNQGVWHIVSFTRQQDKSGLENVHLMAEARLPQTALADLRGKAKGITKPGEAYTVTDVQFTPSDEELTVANKALRSMIYQQARAEIEVLNKDYPEQKFYLYQIDFNATNVMPVYEMRTMNVAASGASSAPQPLNVGNKQTMLATVILAAIPDVIAKKPALVNP